MVLTISSGSRGAKGARCGQNSAMSTKSGQMPKTITTDDRRLPLPMRMQTRRSSVIRSSAVADVTMMSDPRTKVSTQVNPLLGLPADPRSKVVRPVLGSPSKSDSIALACPPVSQPAVAVLARHIQQSVKYWTSKSTAVDAVTVMMTSQPCCSDVVDAILQVPISTQLNFIVEQAQGPKGTKTQRENHT